MRRVCGICGILDRGGDPARRERLVAAMSNALVHRGPDDAGGYADEDVTLGFRRLAVIDLVTGNQPIRLDDDRAVIVLNGEIYNFRELRRDLETDAPFRTRGDVEVVLRLYARHGAAALERLRGMFALAIWDRERRTLLLARDRFGIKPLFVAREGRSVAFASEVSALLAAGLPRVRDLDPLALRHYLDQRYLPPDRTLLAGVTSVPPGTVVEIGPSRERAWAYPQPVTSPAPRSIDEAAESLLPRIRDAVKRQMVADVPLGVFLSGGIDSSVVSAAAAAERGSGLETFSVGFEGEGSVSELPWAAKVAARIGTVHRELGMDPARVADDLDAILARLDGPLGDATALPTWYLCRLARESVTVALSGEGADELFGGYPRQRYDLLVDRAGALGRKVAPGVLALTGRPASPRLRRRLAMEPGLARQLDWSRAFDPEAVDALVAAPVASADALEALQAPLAARWRAIASGDPANARLEADRELYLPGDLLPKVDRMSMAHSLEVRVPFLDEDLADYVAGLPGRMKIGAFRGKEVLRRAVSALLPADVVRRPKQGFEVPIGAWLRGPLRERMLDLVGEASVRRRGLLRPAAAADLVRAHLAREADHGERIWTLMALEGWQRAALDPAGAVR